MQTDLEKVYDYMQLINCIDGYIYNYEKDIDYDSSERIEIYSDPITYAFVWSETPEGDDYWCSVDTDIMKLNIHLSAHDIYEYLKVRTKIPDSNEPYEYW